MTGSGHFDRLELSTLGEQPTRVGLQGLQVVFDRHKGPSGLFLGEQSVTLERLDVHWPGLEPLVLTELAQRDRLSQTDDLLAADLTSNWRD